MKLDIGCGNYCREGYAGVDPYVVTDYRAFMWDLPFKANSVDAIFSSHALEHIAKGQVVPTLREWLRVLKPGGALELIVPDLVACCRDFIAHQSNDWYLDRLYGHQAHAGEFHQTGFTAAFLQSYLEEAGWSVLSIQEVEDHGQTSLFAQATKR